MTTARMQIQMFYPEGRKIAEVNEQFSDFVK